MKNLILLTFLIVTLSCSRDNDSEPVTDTFPRTITPVLVGKSTITLAGDPLQNIVVSNQPQWNVLLNSLNEVNNVSNSFTEIAIDFNNFDVIAAFRNPVSNSGSAVDIISIIENQDNIIVTLKNFSNSVTNDVAQAFHIVKIPKSTKPVVFEME